MAHEHDQGGPIPIPMPTDAKLRELVVERLRGHTTSSNWLPQGLSPELDALREEHLRLRSRLAAELQALRNLIAKFKSEDSEHAEALREAFAKGTYEPQDERTPEVVRISQRAKVEERIWALSAALADHADRVIESIRQHEDDLLADLRRQATAAEEKRRQADELLAQAQADEWKVSRLGQWLQASADDGPFGRQPSPTGSEPPPPRFVMPSDALERPWHRARPWNRSEVEDEVPA